MDLRRRLAALPGDTLSRLEAEDLVLGQPLDPRTTFDPARHPRKLLAFFKDRAAGLGPVERVVTKRGDVAYRRRPPAEIPTLHGAARELGVRRQSLWRWAQRHPIFAHALGVCRVVQHDLVVRAAATGAIDSRFAALVMVNCQGWRHRTRVEHRPGVQLIFRDDAA
jgi:hypothetical protein